MAEEYVLARPAPLTISPEEVDQLLRLGSGDAALLYLYLLKNGGRLDRAAAARELTLSRPIPECMALLGEAGLIREEASAAPPAKPALKEREELPEYTAAEVQAQTDSDPGFRELLNETQNRLGRYLSGAEMKILFGIYSDLGLPTDVILLLLGYCLEECRRRFGEGRKPTLRQIQKEAYVWYREELFNLELADRYLRERAAKRGRLGELCSLLGIRGRSLAPSEEKYLLAWLDMGFGQEAILRAYDKTVSKKGELAWPYMNRILENWHAKGLHTVPEIEAGDRPPRRGSPAGKDAAARPEAGEYDRMQDYMNKLNGGGAHGT